MSRRERLERKIAKRETWAAGASAKSDTAAGTAQRIARRFEGGQPILEGHHSEKRARRDQARMHDAMSKAVALDKLAGHHASKAAGLADQLERSIYSDDHDAVEKLEAKASELEALQERMKSANKAIRTNAKAGADAQVAALVVLGFSEGTARKLLEPDFCRRIGFADYQLTNNGAEIRRTRKRLEQLRADAALAPKVEAARAAAEEAGGVVVEDIGGGYCSVRFAERPERAVLDELRAAGYRWHRVLMVWQGKRDALPADLRDAPAAEPVKATPAPAPVEKLAVLTSHGDGSISIVFHKAPARAIVHNLTNWYYKRTAPKTYRGPFEVWDDAKEAFVDVTAALGWDD